MSSLGIKMLSKKSSKVIRWAPIRIASSALIGGNSSGIVETRTISSMASQSWIDCRVTDFPPAAKISRIIFSHMTCCQWPHYKWKNKTSPLSTPPGFCAKLWMAAFINSDRTMPTYNKFYYLSVKMLRPADDGNLTVLPCLPLAPSSTRVVWHDPYWLLSCQSALALLRLWWLLLLNGQLIVSVLWKVSYFTSGGVHTTTFRQR